MLYNVGMGTQELMDILLTQSTIGRTGKGWDLGDGMLGASQTSADGSSKDDFVAKECLNCGIVLSGEFFASGCPNCGCKDTKEFGAKIEHPVMSAASYEVRVGSVLGPTFFVVDHAQRKAREDSK